MQRSLLSLSVLLAGVLASSGTAAQVPTSPLLVPLDSVAVALVRAAPAVAAVWPPYWGVGQGILLLAPDSAALLLSGHAPPPEYTPVSPATASPELVGRAYRRGSYPSEFTRNRFSLSHPLGSDTVPALPVKSKSLPNVLEFLFHEAFHGYQSRGNFTPIAEDTHRTVWGQRLVDSAQTASSEFAAGVDAERRLLLSALGAGIRADSLETILQLYTALRQRRTGGATAVRDVERSMERLEGSAEFVGCMGTAAALGGGDARVRECIADELRRPLADFPAMPEADARLMRWRLYGTGAALCYLISRLDPTYDWRPLLERGMHLDRLLVEAMGGQWPRERTQHQATGGDQN
ncbi:MAG: hypothetical protein ABW277_23085 [Longimicrobiaceae bacterium]